MCGILACVCCESYNVDGLKACLLDGLKRRGPDRISSRRISTLSADHTAPPTDPLSSQESLSPPASKQPEPRDELLVELVGTLLCMRGEETPQPLGNGQGDYLLWNGNVFGGEIEISPEENDTVRVLEELSMQTTPSGTLSVLSRVHGPWAFVFWQRSIGSLWFGRDVFGRRSLLWHHPSTEELKSDRGCLCLSSVGHYDPRHMPFGYWTEVPASGIFQVELTTGRLETAKLVCYPWMQQDHPFQNVASIAEELSVSNITIALVKNSSLQVPFPPLCKFLPEGFAGPDPASHHHSPCAPTENDARRITEAVTGTGVGVSVEAGISDLSGKPTNLPTYSQDKKPAASATHLDEDQGDVNWPKLAKELIIVLQGAILSRVRRAPRVGCNLISRTVGDDVEINTGSGSEGRLSAASCVVGGKVKGREKVDMLSFGSWSSAEDVKENQQPLYQGKARVGILFSGGVDSVVLAALTDRYNRCMEPSEEIDLINVAFEQTSSLPLASPSLSFDVPDRIAAMKAFQQLNPGRKFNLVLVNVTSVEVNTLRSERIAKLIHPLKTVLDDSIGCAIWFAARGEGLLYCSGTGSRVPYRSNARTLFVGMGADEQLGGYARHRTKFNISGWSGLVSEVEMDIKRLAKRNLGRDDRCIADHQREGQFPFLDETVVGFLQQLPIYHKTDMSLPRGEGEKRLLREAALILGCTAAAVLPKRAIQFGSRIAKLSGSQTRQTREQASDECSRLVPPQ